MQLGTHLQRQSSLRAFRRSFHSRLLNLSRIHTRQWHLQKRYSCLSVCSGGSGGGGPGGQDPPPPPFVPRCRLWHPKLDPRLAPPFLLIDLIWTLPPPPSKILDPPLVYVSRPIRWILCVVYIVWGVGYVVSAQVLCLHFCLGLGVAKFLAEHRNPSWEAKFLAEHRNSSWEEKSLAEHRNSSWEEK